MELGLNEAISLLKSELAAAQEAEANSGIQFHISGVALEFHVAVKKSAEAKAGFKAWVIEAGSTANLSREEIHRVVVNLGPPLDSAGDPIRVRRDYSEKP